MSQYHPTMSPANSMPLRGAEPLPPHMAPNGHPPPPNKPTLQEYFFQAAKDTWLQLGNTCEKMQMNVDAMDSYHQVLRYDKANVSALRGIASILRSEDKYDQAVEYIRSIITAVPNDGESWSSLGHCYLMMDELQQAYSAYQAALYNLRDPKEPKLWYGIGILYDRYGSLDHAEEAFSQVMRMAPNFDKANEIYFRLGIIYKQQTKYDESLQCFKYIVQTPPTPLNQTDIWFQIGHVYEQQKKYEDAKTAYMQVLHRDGKHAKVLQQLGWLHHQQSSDYNSQEQAIEFLEQSVSSDQTDAQSWYLLGRCYMSQHKFPKAYEAYQQAVYRDGRNPTFWCSIGVLYYQINQYRDALDAYSRAIRLNPAISEVWYDLGTLYESCNNQTTDALDAYQRAAELDPNNQAIKSRLDLLRNGQGNQTNGTAPMPQDVPPQAYQPTGAGGPSQGPWGPAPQHAAQAQPVPPPLLARGDWGHLDLHARPPQPPTSYQQYQPSVHQSAHPPPLISRHDQSEQVPRYQVPQHARSSPKSSTFGHDPYRPSERRPLSPSPRTRPSIIDSSRATSIVHPSPSQSGPSHHQPTPSRITNPNYGGQPIPPPTPSSAVAPTAHYAHAPSYGRRATPPTGQHPYEGRPRSPPPYEPRDQKDLYFPPGPSGPANIAMGAPAPLSASTAAEAAARNRERENGLQAKRPRDWESREDLQAKRPRDWESREDLQAQNHKKNASEEMRARLDDPYSRRMHSPNGAPHPDRERLERDRALVGTPSSHVASPVSQRAEDMRRADEAYRPSAVAHQSAPLSTVLRQEYGDASQESIRPSLPSINMAGINGIEPRPPKREELESQKMEVDEEQKDAEPAVRRLEEPAARKVEVDENYDDDSSDETKQNTAAPPSGTDSRASEHSTREPPAVSEARNGIAPEPVAETVAT